MYRDEPEIKGWPISVTFMVLWGICLGGYRLVRPNKAVLLSFMGNYKGTITKPGYYWVNPFWGGTDYSLMLKNYETDVIEVNDKDGTPINIAILISYQLVDTYKAHYDIQSSEEYVKKQFVISLRQYAKEHTYGELSDDVHDFTESLNTVVAIAGYRTTSAHITELSYAEVIAASMLQRQQAKSMASAKQIIVETAVHIAKGAAQEITFANPGEESRFLGQLILVLCSHEPVSVVIPTNH